MPTDTTPARIGIVPDSQLKDQRIPFPGCDLMPVDLFGRRSLVVSRQQRGRLREAMNGQRHERLQPRGTQILPRPAWLSRWPGRKWLLVPACARNRSWRG